MVFELSFLKCQMKELDQDFPEEARFSFSLTYTVNDLKL